MKKRIAFLSLVLASFILAPIARADSAVVFNEIMYHPATNEPAMEWVELHNQLGVDVDISDWHFKGAINYTFPSNTIVRARGFLVLSSSPAALTNGTTLTNVLGPFTGRLSNNGETLELRNNSDRVVDEVSYGVGGPWPVGPDGAGVSLAKIDPEGPTSQPENWTASAQAGGTPGAGNGNLSPRGILAFNEVSLATNSAFIEIRNQGADPFKLDGVILARDGASNQDYRFPNGATLPSGGFLALTPTDLGFAFAPGDKLFLFGPGKTNVFDGYVIAGEGRGRSPDGVGHWFIPAKATPGASNSFNFHNEIVINEIMYHPKILSPASATEPAKASPESWIELFNRGNAAVDLGGWELGGNLNFRFPIGKVIPAGGYLVVAGNAAYLKQLYPTLDIAGEFGGGVSTRRNHVVLRDSIGNPADEVRFYTTGNWPLSANGGGSSLELRDPNADNSKGEAWAASDETGKTQWQTYTYRAVAAVPAGNGQPTQWNDFVMGLLSEGECLVDDISVIESPNSAAPVQFLTNGDFESGLAGWRVLGTHVQSHVIVDPSNPTNHVLHLISTGYQEHMHNHIERTYNTGRRVTNGREYEISFRARWLAGNNGLNTRLYFNRAPRTTILPTPLLTGTPGRKNSRFEPNIGPTFGGLSHFPVIPKTNETVAVSIAAQDPQGIKTIELWWSADGGAWTNAPMTEAAPGYYLGQIPPGGAIKQFYVRAVDTLGAEATYPKDGPASGALYSIDDGQANLPIAHNVRIVLTPANTSLLHALTNVESNDLLPCTVIFDESRAYYDCGVHLRGSERGRYSDNRTGFHIVFPPEDLFHGVHPAMMIDRSGAGDATSNRQEEILLKHMMNRAGGITATYPEICRLIAPKKVHTGPAQFFPRHEDLFLETAFPTGNSTMFEMELIYFPTTANAAGYKNPQPDDVIGTDLTNLGNDKEFYRYNFMIKNNRDEDDYRGLVALGKAWSLTGAALDAQTRQIMDIDEWMRTYALVSLCAVGDMYTFGNNHNFFMCQRPDGKFVYFPWDMDFSFSRGATASLVGDQNLAKVVNLPGNLRRMYAHMLDIINVSFNTNYMAYWTAHYQKAATPGNVFSGSYSTIGARANFVRNTINSASGGGSAPFAINGGDTQSVDTNLVVLSGTAPNAIQSMRVNGREYPITWTSVTAWKMQVPVSQSTNLLELTAYDLKGNALTNFARTITVNYNGAIPDPSDAIVFNEILYNPLVPDSGFVELYNKSNFSFDLSGWRINGIDYTFPKGSIITNGQYLTITSSRVGFNLAYGNAVPAPFDNFSGSLQNNGETLTLLRPGTAPGEEIVVDKVRYENLPPWPLGADGSGGSLQLIDAAQDNSRVGNWADGSAWRKLTYTGVPGDGAAGLQFYLAAAGELYIDDVVLVEQSAAATNLIANGSFENGDITPWTLSGNHTNSLISTNYSHSGKSSLKLSATAAGTAFASLSQTFASPLDPAKTYTLSFWYLPSNSGSGVNFSVTPAFRGLVNYRMSTPGAANNLAGSLAPFPPVWLNEVAPENPSGLTDRFNEHDPWIEIYNAGSAPVSLAGFSLSPDYLSQWAFPTGAVLAAGERKVIFADNQPSQSNASEWHTNFRLKPGAGSIGLFWSGNGAPAILDYLNYDSLAAGQTYGDYPDGQPFDRQNFFKPTPGAANDNAAPPLAVVINEWMASNSGFLLNTNNNNRYDDWFELYNPNNTSANLAGFFLTRNLDNTTQFEIPAGYVIPPHGFLLVWADSEPGLNRTNDPALHVNFKLDKDGDQIGLFAADRRQIDAVAFDSQFSDVSQGRYPDGAASLYYLAKATPASPNLSWANREPIIDPVGSVGAAPGQTAQVRIFARDLDQPAQSLSYTLAGLIPSGAAIDPATGLFTWVTDPAASPGTNVFTVRVTDNGTPPLSAVRSFAVVLGLRVNSVTRSPAGQVAISIGAIPGKTYRVEYKNSLSDAAWTIGQIAKASTGILNLADDTASQKQRFYRIIQVD